MTNAQIAAWAIIPTSDIERDVNLAKTKLAKNVTKRQAERLHGFLQRMHYILKARKHVPQPC